MAIYKRGQIYWYKFTFNGEAIRESTRQKNQHTARQMEAAHRTSLAKGEVGIREKQRAPTLKDFCEQRLKPWAKATFESTCPNNWLWFRGGIRRLTAYEVLANTKLDESRMRKWRAFAVYEQSRMQNRGRGEDEQKCGLAVSSINSAIRVLRRILNLAAEWGVIESTPKLPLLPGENHRERVVTRRRRAGIWRSLLPLLVPLCNDLGDTGVRPDECYRLCWEDVTWATVATAPCWSATERRQQPAACCR